MCLVLCDQALDGVPVVGHVKGLAHLAAGDKEGKLSSTLRAGNPAVS